MKTLEEILKEEQAHKEWNENGTFGINACKEEIEWKKEHLHQSYFQQLEEYVERANNEFLFNSTMVLACWLLINNK